MITTTELGQLATEYLDDRKQEFLKLEESIKKQLAMQEQSKQEVKRQVDDMSAQMHFFVRRDVSNNERLIHSIS